MRITFFIPTILVLICAAAFFWFANEPVALVQPTPLLRAAEELVGAEDQTQYSRKLDQFRKVLYAQGDADFPRTREVLLSYVVARDRAARRIPDPGFQPAILSDVLAVSSRRIEERTFRQFLLGGTLLLVAGALLFVQGRKYRELALAVRAEFPCENLTTFSANLHFLLKALKNKAFLIEDLQGSIADLNGQLRQIQLSPQFQHQFRNGWNEQTLLMEESNGAPVISAPVDSDSFPSLSISAEFGQDPSGQGTEVNPLDLDPPNLFEPKGPVVEIDYGATGKLPKPSVLPPDQSEPGSVPEVAVEKSLFTGSPSQTSELLYTQFLLGLADTTEFPPGSQVFRITVLIPVLEDLGRTYQDSQFGVRLFGFCVERILTYFRMTDRTVLHFDEGTFTLHFCVPAFLHGAVNEEEIDSAFRSKAIYLSGIPVSLPDFQITEYRA